MTNRLLNILYTGVLLILAAACSKEETLPLDSGEGKVQVTFTLAVDGAAARSRATTWGDDYDPWAGGSYDNRIEPEKLQVLICNTDGTPLAKVQKLLYYQTTDQSIYTFTGVVEEIERTDNDTYKIMVFANCPDVTEEYSTDDLGSLSFDYASTTTSIPMWGVQKITSGLE